MSFDLDGRLVRSLLHFYCTCTCLQRRSAVLCRCQELHGSFVWNNGVLAWLATFQEADTGCGSWGTPLCVGDTRTQQHNTTPSEGERAGKHAYMRAGGRVRDDFTNFYSNSSRAPRCRLQQSRSVCMYTGERAGEPLFRVEIPAAPVRCSGRP